MPPHSGARRDCRGEYFSGSSILSQDGHLIVEQASTSYVNNFDLDGANDAMTFRL